MLSGLSRSIPAQWTSFISHWCRLCGFSGSTDRAAKDTPNYAPPEPEQRDQKPTKGIINVPNEHDAVSRQADHDTPIEFPPTEEQLEERINNFVNSIDQDAVCRLASRYHDQKPCSVVGKDSGSFNVCFFVHFNSDNSTWVVRVPIEPVVHDVWGKTQSEVTTIRYLESSTTIPVPHIHAYGKGEKLTKDDSTATQAFLILDYIPGQPLNMATLLDAPEERRKSFYSELIDILVQMRQLEFPKAGSLMPNPDDESIPVVGNLLSMAANELQRCYKPRYDFNIFTSSEHFTDYQYQILSETYRLPTEDLSREQVELELFALESLAEQIPEVINSQWPNGPFVLTHLDLRCGNIIVNEHLHILGVIDWEFTGTIPPQLFTPPPWITGHDLAMAAGMRHDTIRSEFYDVLRTKSRTSRTCSQLEKQWDYQQQQLIFPIAQILRHPSTLIRVYYRFLFRQLFKGNRDEVVSEFFQRKGTKSNLALIAERRMDESKRYTEYLESQGLLIDRHSEAQENQELLAKIQEALERYRVE